jgi:hypothetical protein
MLGRDESFFLWGNTPNLYLLANRRPPTSVLFDSHLHPNPLFNVLSERVIADLAATRPALLVVENSRRPVPDWITKDFENEPILYEPDGYSVYTRSDGKTEVQTRSR